MRKGKKVRGRGRAIQNGERNLLGKERKGQSKAEWEWNTKSRFQSEYVDPPVPGHI